MKKILVFVLVVFSTTYAISQGCHSDILLKNTTIGGIPAIAATGGLVNVCLETDKAIPCTTMSVVLLYSDSALTKPISNPVSTDNKGNYSWCAASGTYNQQPTGSGIITKTSGPITIPINQASSQALSDAAPHNFTNTITTNGAFTANGIETHNGNNTFNSNNVLTGENQFRAINNVYYTSAELDGPGTALNLDICGAIARGWAWAVAKGWSGVVVNATSWHGSQACASQMFASYPYNSGVNQTFTGRVVLSPNVDILTTASQVLPANAEIDGQSTHAYGNPLSVPPTGAVIQPSSAAFPINTPVIEYGATNTGGGAPTQGIHLRNLAVSCHPPDNSFIAGSIGIRNQFAQDTSGGSQLYIDGCWAGLEFEQGGTEGGSQNTGSWEDIHIAMSNVTDATASCIKVGATGLFAGPIKGIGPVSCVNTSGILLNVGVQIDGPGVVMHDSHIESFNKAVVVGANRAVTGGALRDIYCVPSAFSVNTCVELMSPNVSSFEIENLHGFSPITNLLIDHNPNGGTIAFSAETHLTFYARGGGSGTAGNNNVLTTSTQVPSVISQTAPAEIFRTTDYTTSAADNDKLISFNCSVACTLTLPNPVPFTGWGIRVLNFGSAATTVNVNGVNANGTATNIVLPGSTTSSLNISGLSTNYHYQTGFIPSYNSVVNVFGGGSCSGFLKSDGTCVAGTGAFQLSGSQINATQTSVTVGTETTLYSVTVPAATLAVGNKLECNAGWQRNTPVSGMVYKWYFGATSASQTAATTNTTMQSMMQVLVKTSTSEQMNISPLLSGSSFAAGWSFGNTPAEAISGSILVKLTATGSDATNALLTANCVVTP